MRRQFITGAMALALAGGMSTSAMAFGHGGGGMHGGGMHGGFSHGGFGGVHAGMAGVHGGAFSGPRFAGVRGYSSWRHGGWGGRRVVGGYGGWGYPYDANAGDIGLVGLGLGLAGVATGYCGPYDYDYGYCGAGYSGYGTPIDAWSW